LITLAGLASNFDPPSCTSPQICFCLLKNKQPWAFSDFLHERKKHPNWVW
jgi:hypothetical protein